MSPKHPCGRLIARSLALGLGSSLLLADPDVAFAQDETLPKSVLDLPREGYEAPDHRIGPFVVSATANVRVEYDNNIFARQVDRTEDILVTVRPAVRAALDSDRMSWVTEAQASVFRFGRNTSENHEGYAVGSRLAWTGQPLTLGGRVGFERTFESRNDPEARRLLGAGPRLFTIALAEGFAGLEGSRTGLLGKFTAERYDFLSALDDERDFTSYQASLRARYRLTGRVNLFAQTYWNRRDFRLATDRSGVDRDSTSKAILLGVTFDQRARLRGEIAAGVLHFTPRDRSLGAYTGWEMRGALVYQPRERTAITLDAFRGDVATVRLGATGRVDTRVRLGIQQEARHDLLMNAGLGWRKTRFRGVAGQAKQTWAADGEIEYLMNRYVSVALTAQYVKRTVDGALAGSLEGFDRFRAGLELRFKF